jgi:hypothetical protein
LTDDESSQFAKLAKIDGEAFESVLTTLIVAACRTARRGSDDDHAHGRRRCEPAKFATSERLTQLSEALQSPSSAL